MSPSLPSLTTAYRPPTHPPAPPNRFTIGFVGSVAVQPAPFNTMTTYSRARQLARLQMELQLRPRGSAASQPAAPSPASVQTESYESADSALADSARLAGGAGWGSWRAERGGGGEVPKAGGWGWVLCVCGEGEEKAAPNRGVEAIHACPPPLKHRISPLHLCRPGVCCCGRRAGGRPARRGRRSSGALDHDGRARDQLLGQVRGVWSGGGGGVKWDHAYAPLPLLPSYALTQHNEHLFILSALSPVCMHPLTAPHPLPLPPPFICRLSLAACEARCRQAISQVAPLAGGSRLEEAVQVCVWISEAVQVWGT